MQAVFDKAARAAKAATKAAKVPESADVPCARCALRDDSEGNAILLCDGDGCKAAYHQYCLPRPLLSVPDGEWLCPACEAAPKPTSAIGATDGENAMESAIPIVMKKRPLGRAPKGKVWNGIAGEWEAEVGTDAMPHGQDLLTPVQNVEQENEHTDTDEDGLLTGSRRAAAAPDDTVDMGEVREVMPCALWRKGSKMDALDKAGTWYESKVVDERGQGDARELLVHYSGWKARYDEWVGVGSGRLRTTGVKLGPNTSAAGCCKAASDDDGVEDEEDDDDPSLAQRGINPLTTPGPRPPAAPPSKFEHGTARIGADGYSRWRVGQSARGASQWEQVGDGGARAPLQAESSPAVVEGAAPPGASMQEAAVASTSAVIATPIRLGDERRSPATAATASAALASRSKEAGLPTPPSQDACLAGRAATGAERVAGVSGAPAKYRIKRRPCCESGDGDSASHAAVEDAARGGGAAGAAGEVAEAAPEPAAAAQQKMGPGTVGLQPDDPALLLKIQEQQQEQLKQQQLLMKQQQEMLQKQAQQQQEQQQVLARSPALRQMQQQAGAQQQQMRQQQMMQVQQVAPMQRLALQQMHAQQMQQLVAQHNAQIQQASQLVMQQHAASLLEPKKPEPQPQPEAQPAASEELSEEQRMAVELMAPLIATHGDKFLQQMKRQHAGDDSYYFLDEEPGSTPARRLFDLRLAACLGKDAPAAAGEGEGGGWVELADEQGRPYFVNQKKNITTWIRPDELSQQEGGTKKGRTAGGWTEFKMDGGRTYYYHTAKQETQWTMPVEFEVIPDEPEPPPPPPDDGGKHSEKRAKREQRRRVQEAAGAEHQAAEETAVERPMLAALQAQAEVGEGAGQAFSEMLTEKSRTHPQAAPHAAAPRAAAPRAAASRAAAPRAAVPPASPAPPAPAAFPRLAALPPLLPLPRAGGKAARVRQPPTIPTPPPPPPPSGARV